MLMTPNKNEDRKQIYHNLYDAADAGIKVIIGMHASLQNAMYVVMPFLLMPDFVLIGKIILNPVLDGFTHHFTNSLMTREIRR